MDFPTSLENRGFIKIINLVTNIINGRQLKKILDKKSGSSPKAKPKKAKISKRIVKKL